MKSFTRLPFWLSDDDVKSLRAVNKSLNAAVDRATWEVLPIVLNLSRDNLDLGMTMLEVYAVSLGERGQVRDNISIRERCWALTPDEPDTEEIIEARRRLPEVSSKALSALKGLTAIRWRPVENDPKPVHIAIMRSIGLLLHLVDFQINAETCANIPPIHFLKNGSLRKLVIRQTFPHISDSAQFITSLVTVLIHNPLLDHLELDTAALSDRHLLPFQHLLRSIPTNTVELRALMLRGWSVPAEAIPQVRPHLRLLRSINLCPWAPNRHPQGPESCRALWRSLLDSGLEAPLPLRHISCTQICEELLDLLRLESIQGLESLEVNDTCEDTDEDYNRLAQQFLDQVFHHRYQGTLKELTLIPSFTGDWTIGLGNLDRFDGCKELTYLCVALDPDEVSPGAGDEDVVVRYLLRAVGCESDARTLQASFIACISRLPNLSRVVFRPVCSRANRFAQRQQDHPWIAKQRILENIKQSVEKAAIPNTFSRALRIILKGYNPVKPTLVFVSDDGDGALTRFRQLE
ncbi:hypothetical protein AAF712_000686 [Marasmius tenuissimus]|uniref:F-box domain-containing protein n=1 Tax=Marasmius tenuissimus TaxID=585030 RepID=A0ABR3AEJ9_9AGAR